MRRKTKRQIKQELSREITNKLVLYYSTDEICDAIDNGTIEDLDNEERTESELDEFTYLCNEWLFSGYSMDELCDFIRSHLDIENDDETEW